MSDHPPTGQPDHPPAGPPDDTIAAVWAEVRPNQLRLARELADASRRADRDPRDTEAWERVRALAHRLAGTLGTFEQEVAGEAAVSLDEVVSTVETPDAATTAQAVGLAEAIVTAIEHHG